MSDSAAFEAACSALETGSTLDRLEARGTIRLVLKQAGLEAKSVKASELRVVIERLLPAELAARGVEQPDVLCGRIAQALQGVTETAVSGDTPESVFSRLGGS